MHNTTDGCTEVLAVLIQLAERGEWTGSQSVLASQCGCSVRTLARRLTVLKADGRVVVQRQPG